MPPPNYRPIYPFGKSLKKLTAPTYKELKREIIILTPINTDKCL